MENNLSGAAGSGHHGRLKAVPSATLDPVLASCRIPPTGLCWWCGAPATSAEHKFKLSDLKRMATVAGKVDPTSLYKGGEFWSGELKGIKTGLAVRWGKSMCKRCNNERSQPFDLAYEIMSDYIWHHQSKLRRRAYLDVAAVYGPKWQIPAINTARYLAKQLACCLTDEQLPLPQGLVEFLDGAVEFPNVVFDVVQDHSKRDLFDASHRQGSDTRGYWIMPGGAQISRSTGKLTEITYGYCIGYVCLRVTWREYLQGTSFFQARHTRMPTVGDRLPRELRRSLRRSAD